MKKWFYHRNSLLGLISICLLLVSFSCKKTKDTVPYVYVNEYLNLNLPSNLNLNVTGGWIYYGAGNKGLIIFRRSFSEFGAYDRTCPYDPSTENSLIWVQNNTFFAIDSVCGSKFNLYDGSVTQGPSSYPLKQYNAELLSNNSLHIYN